VVLYSWALINGHIIRSRGRGRSPIMLGAILKKKLSHITADNRQDGRGGLVQGYN
jgi:hypothetical protein